MIFISGQIPINPETGEMTGITVEDQTRQVLKNLQAILKQEHLTLDSIVKTTIFMRDLTRFSTVNEIYGDFLNGTTFPARACVEVSKLPKDALIEIEAIAVR